MPAKKKVKKRPDVDIKIRNLDKVIRADRKKKGKNMCGMGGGCNFWVFGSALAMVMSYARSEAILWAILHGALSWLYVLYRAMQIWGWF